MSVVTETQQAAFDGLMQKVDEVFTSHDQATLFLKYASKGPMRGEVKLVEKIEDAWRLAQGNRPNLARISAHRIKQHKDRLRKYELCLELLLLWEETKKKMSPRIFANLLIAECEVRCGQS